MGGSSAGPRFVHPATTSIRCWTVPRRSRPRRVERLGCPRWDDRPRKHVRCQRVLQLTTKAGIKPIIGVEAYIAPGSRFDTGASCGVTPARPTTSPAAAPTRTGDDGRERRSALFKLSSHASFEGQLSKWSRTDAELIAEHAEASSSPRMPVGGGANPPAARPEIGRRSKPRRSGGRSSDRFFASELMDGLSSTPKA